MKISLEDSKDIDLADLQIVLSRLDAEERRLRAFHFNRRHTTDLAYEPRLNMTQKQITFPDGRCFDVVWNANESCVITA